MVACVQVTLFATGNMLGRLLACDLSDRLLVARSLSRAWAVSVLTLGMAVSQGLYVFAQLQDHTTAGGPGDHAFAGALINSPFYHASLVFISLFTDGLYTKGSRAHTHRELI